MDALTFALAMLGYVGLTVTAVRAAFRTVPMGLWRATAGLIVIHTALVWHVRYEWDLAVATQNGYAGFLMFHAALATIVSSVFASEPLRSRLIWASFLVVSLGAAGAVFLYDVVAVYRVPVLALAGGGVGALLLAARRGRLRVR